MKAPYGVGPTGSEASTGTGSGFFSTIKSVGTDIVGEVGNIAKDVVPNWTRNALQDQMGDQLADSTFNRTEAPPRMGGFARTTGGNAGATAEPQTQKTLWDTYKGLNVSGATAALLLITTGVVIYGIVK